MDRRPVFALAVSGLLAHAGTSSGAEIEDLCTNIRGKGPTATERFDAMQACIIKLAQELELRPEVVPSGAVVAFATECPQPGWEEYKEGWGRFIVGAVSAQRLKEIPGGFFRDSGGRDLTPKPIGEPGGEASHILTVEEMPPHTHGLNRSKGSDLSNNVILYSGSVVSTESGDPPQTHPIGGGLPHNNMPPYVALQLCKKK